jgi:hypothetical protein
VELPAKASVHINMQQDFTQRAAELQPLRDRAYGGFFIRAESPTARILVKEHIFSQSRQVASPYYGSVDIIVSHHIQSYPPQMVAGQNATAQTMTCYYSGCYWNGWQISSHHPSIVSTQWLPGWVPRPITAHQPGNATLHSSAQGPINQYSDLGWKDDAVIISVYDATPVINAIVPNTIPAGGSQIAEIYGVNFGSNPTVSATGGIQVTRLYHSPTQINLQFSAPATPPGNHNLMVTSNGLTGVFLQAPGGGSQSQSQSQPQNTQVTPTISVTPDGWSVTLSADADPGISTSVQLAASSNPSVTSGYSWITTSPDKITLSSSPVHVVSALSQGQSGSRNDVEVSVSVTINGISIGWQTTKGTVVEPTRLVTVSNTFEPTGHQCVTSTPNPGEVGCGKKTYYPGQHNYTTYCRKKLYHVHDHLVPSARITSVMLVREDYNAPSGVCAPTNVDIGLPSYATELPDCFNLCHTTCQQGSSPTCGVTATQSIRANGYLVFQKPINWTCAGVTVPEP